MGEDQAAEDGAESALPLLQAPTAAVPPRAEPRLVSRLALAPLLTRLQAAALKLRGGSSVYADPVIWATAAVVFGAYAAISLFRLLTLNPTTFDLAIYTEYVKQYADLHAPIVDVWQTNGNLLGDHFAPIVALIAPFFRVFPSAATLLVAQALLAAASVFAVSQLAREKLGRGPARAIAVAYGFCWGLQQLANFDFHEIAFAVPLLAFSLSALARGRIMAAMWWALPLVFVKEDQGYTVAAIGIYLMVSGLRARSRDRAQAADSGGRRRLAAGPVLLNWGVAWSFVAIAVIIPHFNPAGVYRYWIDSGGVLAPGQHLTVLGLISQLFHAWAVKLGTIVMLLLPTAFIALRSPLILIALPSLLLRFISADSAYWGTYWHYNATVMPILFLAAIDGLARITARMDADPGSSGPGGWASGQRGLWRAAQAGARRYGAAMMLAIAVPFAFQFPLSQLWNGHTYQVTPHVADAEAAMARVPNGATVLATLDLLPPLAARTDVFWIGNKGNPETEYIVFDGVNSDYAPPPTNVPAFVDGLYPAGTYKVIYTVGDVYVFQRTW